MHDSAVASACLHFNPDGSLSWLPAAKGLTVLQVLEENAVGVVDMGLIRYAEDHITSWARGRGSAEVPVDGNSLSNNIGTINICHPKGCNQHCANARCIHVRGVQFQLCTLCKAVHCNFNGHSLNPCTHSYTCQNYPCQGLLQWPMDGVNLNKPLPN